MSSFNSTITGNFTLPTYGTSSSQPASSRTAPFQPPPFDFHPGPGSSTAFDPALYWLGKEISHILDGLSNDFNAHTKKLTEQFKPYVMTIASFAKQMCKERFTPFPANLPAGSIQMKTQYCYMMRFQPKTGASSTEGAQSSASAEQPTLESEGSHTDLIVNFFIPEEVAFADPLSLKVAALKIMLKDPSFNRTFLEKAIEKDCRLLALLCVLNAQNPQETLKAALDYVQEIDTAHQTESKCFYFLKLFAKESHSDFHELEHIPESFFSEELVNFLLLCYVPPQDLLNYALIKEANLNVLNHIIASAPENSMKAFIPRYYIDVIRTLSTESERTETIIQYLTEQNCFREDEAPLARAIDSVLKATRDDAPLKVIRYLIEENKDADGKTIDIRANSGPLLETAINKRHWPLVAYLLQKGVNINAINTEADVRISPISRAFSNSYLTPLYVIQLLLDANPDLNIADYRGATALHWFSCYLTQKPFGSTVEVMKKLLEKGANPFQRDNRGELPLSWLLTQFRSNLKIQISQAVKLLLEKMGDLSAYKEPSDLFLHLAIESGFPLKIIRLLIDKGANVHAVNQKQQTALHSAALVRPTNPEIFEYLINAGVDPHALDYIERIAWMYIEEEAILNQTLQIKNKTILSQALRNFKFSTASFNLNLIKNLVEAGADPYEKGLDGKNAFDLAKELPNTWVLKKLTEVCAAKETANDLLIKQVAQFLKLLGW